MSEAVRELVKLAMELATKSITYTTSHDALPLRLIDAAVEVEIELSKSPQQMHDEHLQEVLKWPR